jgi:hypothetical protein
MAEPPRFWGRIRRLTASPRKDKKGARISLAPISSYAGGNEANAAASGANEFSKGAANI